MALESGLIRPQEIFEIRRITFGLRGLLYNTSADGLQLSSFSGGSFNLASLEQSFSGLSFGSWAGSSELSFAGSFETSWLTSGRTSWGAVPFFSAGNWSSFSGSASSFQQLSFETSGFSFGGSFDVGQSSAYLSSFSGSFAGSAGQFGFVPVDNIGGGIVHFYNAFYDQSSSWWKTNNTNVIPQLDQYWKSGSANFQ